MATWKKVIVSGSSAELSALKVDTLLNGVVTGSSNGTLGIQPINGTGNIVATSGATGLSHTGSFSGSFFGTFTGTTNLPDLTQGTGIVPFLYDGGTTATVAVSGAAQLNNNTVTKWNSTDGKFVNSTMTDDGTTVTVSQNLTVNSNLTVLGTASFQSTTNVEVADRFILLASGSNTTGDGGLVVQQATQDVGELFGFDSGTTRWAFTSSFTANGSSFTPDAFVAAALIGTGTNPTAVAARYQVGGNIFIGTDENIWIYS